MQQILQSAIAPWKRGELRDEEARVAEIRRRPVRNKYGAEEAKRRLGSQAAKRGRRRTGAARPGAANSGAARPAAARPANS